MQRCTALTRTRVHVMVHQSKMDEQGKCVMDEQCQLHLLRLAMTLPSYDRTKHVHECTFKANITQSCTFKSFTTFPNRRGGTIRAPSGVRVHTHSMHLISTSPACCETQVLHSSSVALLLWGRSRWGCRLWACHPPIWRCSHPTIGSAWCWGW